MRWATGASLGRPDPRALAVARTARADARFQNQSPFDGLSQPEQPVLMDVNPPFPKSSRKPTIFHLLRNRMLIRPPRRRCSRSPHCLGCQSRSPSF